MTENLGNGEMSGKLLSIPSAVYIQENTGSSDISFITAIGISVRSCYFQFVISLIILTILKCIYLENL